jgi:hypothetical protein
MDMWDDPWHLVEAAATVLQHVPGIFQQTRNSCNKRAQLQIQRNWEHFQYLSQYLVNMKMLFKSGE